MQSYKAGSYLDDAWVLRLRRGATAGAWHKGLPSPCRPSARSLHTMNAVHSPAEPTALAVLFGGRVRSATDGQTGGWALSDSSELWVGSVTAAQEGGVTVAWSPARPESGDDACSLQPGAGDCRPRVLLEDSGAEAGLPQWPEARHGHASALSVRADGTASLWVFGGAGGRCPSPGGAGKEQLPRQGGGCLLGDLWVLELRAAASRQPADHAGCQRQVRLAGWARVRPVSGSALRPRLAAWPGPRKHAAMAWVGGGELVLHGGAECLPSCECLADTWLGTVEGGRGGVRWEAVLGRGRASTCSGGRPGGGDVCPAPRYRHSLTADALVLQRAARDGNGTGEQPDCPGVAAGACGSPFAGGAWLFGGEAYMPSRYFDDLWRLAPARRGAADALVDALLAAVVSSVASVGFTAAWVPGSAWITLGGFAAAPS